ncbi:serine/threonine-protein kinase 17A-like [Ochotona princeps]|uniref:serine/threonine-protein kinase 17A-like n=1 Tax=Ochotona princeps TaxID=9978 RepID=UPI002714A765|nr:serine/threonine-protein kinase 17A-like [Ochotona princeps]
MRNRRKGQECWLEVIHEIAVLELAQDNPWVIRFHEVYEISSHVVLVLDCATLGETFDQCVTHRCGTSSKKHAQKFMWQILEGVLHSHDVIPVHLKMQRNYRQVGAGAVAQLANPPPSSAGIPYGCWFMFQLLHF